MKSALLACLVVSIVALNACGGGSTSSPPPPQVYKISASVTGLNLGATLVLQNNGGDNLSITADGTFSFATAVSSGAAYAVTVLTQPSGETCSLGSNASGNATSNVTVAVNCSSSSNTFSISVSVSGLTSGTLVLQDDAGQQLSFTSSTTQTFSNTYASGAQYAVRLVTQPTGETCATSGATSGTITANITISVSCATAATQYTLSVTTTGLTGTLVVQDNLSDSLTFTSNTPQTFATAYTSGSTYSVAVVTQPAGQTCTLSSNASGTITANVTVTATCTTSVVNYTLSVMTTGLTGSLTVQDNQSDSLTFTTNTTTPFAKTYTSGAPYSVTISSQPNGETCTLSDNATGTMTGNTTVTASCAPNYTISVMTTGLSGTLVVQDNKLDTLTFTADTTLPFTSAYASGSSYTVTVKTQPTGQTCSLSSNATGTITSNITVTATCSSVSTNPTLSVNVTGVSGSVQLQDDQGDTLTFSSGGTQTFTKSYTSGSKYTIYVTSQPTAQACTPTYSTGTISANLTINVACATGATRALGSVSAVSSISCAGAIKNGVCQQMTVSCPGVPDVQAYVKTNAPTGTPLGTVTYNTGTDGNGLYESIFTYGQTAVQNVLTAGFTTVQISWGTPFNNNQPDGWVQGTGGVLANACRYATVTQWIYNNIQNNTSLPLCATANSGGAGALAYALSQYPSSNVLSMAEVTSGPPTGRLDWGCGCKQGKVAVQCGSSTTLGTCFGTADAPVWDPAYDPTLSPAVCSNAVTGTLPPGGLNFFLGDSVEAPGANYNLSKTHVNLVFGGADNSSAIPIGQDWFNNITTTKSQVCVPGGLHSIANTLAGAQQIANDLIGMCKVQP